MIACLVIYIKYSDKFGKYIKMELKNQIILIKINRIE